MTPRCAPGRIPELLTEWQGGADEGSPACQQIQGPGGDRLWGASNTLPWMGAQG